MQCPINDAVATVAGAFANPKRLQMLTILGQAERSVDDLAKQTGQSIAATSAHLKILREADLLTSRKEGKRVIYTLAGTHVFEFLLSLRNLSEHISPRFRERAHRFGDSVQQVEEMSVEELLQAVEAGEVVLIDVRPEVEFDAGHYRGAESVPVHKLSAETIEWLQMLPAGTKVVVTCRGRYCQLAVEAMTTLREHHINASHLPISYPEWLVQQSNSVS